MTSTDWDILLLPRTDAFQNEYLPPHEELLQALTGFTGSAGFLALRQDGTGALFVDGRYLLQAANEVDTKKIVVVSILETTPTEWVRASSCAGQRLAIDPWRVTPKQYNTWQGLAASVGATLHPLPQGWEKTLWPRRPAPAPSHISEHPEAIAGQSRTDKIALVRRAISNHQAEIGRAHV